MLGDQPHEVKCPSPQPMPMRSWPPGIPEPLGPPALTA